MNKKVKYQIKIILSKINKWIKIFKFNKMENNNKNLILKITINNKNNNYKKAFLKITINNKIFKMKNLNKDKLINLKMINKIQILNKDKLFNHKI